MPMLSEVLGALMADLAQARYYADQQTLLLARRYQADPLLRDLSVPRIRLPEVVVDLPVVVERCLNGTPTLSEAPSGAASKPPSGGQLEEFVRQADGVLRKLAQDAGPQGATSGPLPSLSVYVGANDLQARAGSDGTFATRLRIKLHEDALECTQVHGDGRGDDSLRLIPE